MTYSGVYVFGDSLVDAGNALALAEWYGDLTLSDLPDGAPTEELGYFEGRFADGYGPGDCLVWDATRPNPAIAFMAAQMRRPELPTPIGVLRRVEAEPHERLVVRQIEQETERRGVGSLEKLLGGGGSTWTVHEDGSVS